MLARELQHVLRWELRLDESKARIAAGAACPDEDECRPAMAGDVRFVRTALMCAGGVVSAHRPGDYGGSVDHPGGVGQLGGGSNLGWARGGLVALRLRCPLWRPWPSEGS